uniref:Programmed cell death protein 4 n=1 Tax=Aceria tosichella TaxID=561515 RepID=A0A6G1S521_9ACAR
MEEGNKMIGRQQAPTGTLRNHRSASTSLSLGGPNQSHDLMTKFTNDVRRANNNNNHVNQRRSRGRFGRGLAKKNGAGGHYTWGAAGSEFSGDQLKNGMDPMIDTSDPHDPNYDSDSEENCKFEAITPPLDDDEVERFLKPVLLDYFEHGDTGEVISTLDEVNMSGNYFRIPIVLISLALDRKSSHRELASILISDLFGKVLRSEDIQRAFDLLLQQLDDLELDTPDASTVLGNFIARAIADDCIPPKYVTTAKEFLESKRDTATATTADPIGDHQLSASETRALASLTYANSLINAKRGLIRLDTVWGLTGGARPVKYLIKQMRLLLKEYLSSLDIKEAERCLRELEVPHFLHEFVYEAILMGIEDTKTPEQLTAIANLLKSLSDINLISVDQMKKGFMRLFNEIPEIHIDVPYAYSTLERFMQSCFEVKLFLPRDVIASVPTRGRKRFISEGDGGRVKE